MKINETTQAKINELLSRLSSAYQENAIENAIDNFTSGEYSYTRQEFADECCDNYRDTLKGLDLKDIYKGFEKYGDETELQDIAYLIYDLLESETTTTIKDLFKQVETTNELLRKLNEKEYRIMVFFDDFTTTDNTSNFEDFKKILKDYTSEYQNALLNTKGTFTNKGVIVFRFSVPDFWGREEKYKVEVSLYQPRF